MRRRFLQCFQQGIERILRQHVNFVDDINLVTRRHCRIAHGLDNLADIVDAGVRCGIHFNDVDVPTLRNRDTGFADTARINRRPALPVLPDAVECLGDQPRCRCLAHAADTGQQERMGQAVALDRIAQRRHHRILADKLGKSLWAVFAGKDAIGLRCGHCFYP